MRQLIAKLEAGRKNPYANHQFFPFMAHLLEDLYGWANGRSWGEIRRIRKGRYHHVEVDEARWE